MLSRTVLLSSLDIRTKVSSDSTHSHRINPMSA